MSNKLIDNKKRAHAEKVLERNSTKNSSKNAVPKTHEDESSVSHSDKALREQYKVIRADLMKLRDDLVKGYVLAKDWMGAKTVMIRSK